jgi:hypothetical protein
MIDTANIIRLYQPLCMMQLLKSDSTVGPVPGGYFGVPWLVGIQTYPDWWWTGRTIYDGSGWVTAYEDGNALTWGAVAFAPVVLHVDQTWDGAKIVTSTYANTMFGVKLGPASYASLSAAADAWAAQQAALSHDNFVSVGWLGGAGRSISKDEQFWYPSDTAPNRQLITLHSTATEYTKYHQQWRYADMKYSYLGRAADGMPYHFQTAANAQAWIDATAARDAAARPKTGAARDKKLASLLAYQARVQKSRTLAADRIYLNADLKAKTLDMLLREINEASRRLTLI